MVRYLVKLWGKWIGVTVPCTASDGICASYAPDELKRTKSVVTCGVRPCRGNLSEDLIRR